jgi:hypothetical protein
MYADDFSLQLSTLHLKPAGDSVKNPPVRGISS